jgi:hypothetical protein
VWRRHLAVAALEKSSGTCSACSCSAPICRAATSPPRRPNAKRCAPSAGPGRVADPGLVDRAPGGRGLLRQPHPEAGAGAGPAPVRHARHGAAPPAAGGNWPARCA